MHICQRGAGQGRGQLSANMQMTSKLPTAFGRGSRAEYNKPIG
jgi:hypothetical protein